MKKRHYPVVIILAIALSSFAPFYNLLDLIRRTEDVQEQKHGAEHGVYHHDGYIGHIYEETPPTLDVLWLVDDEEEDEYEYDEAISAWLLQTFGFSALPNIALHSIPSETIVVHNEDELAYALALPGPLHIQAANDIALTSPHIVGRHNSPVLLQGLGAAFMPSGVLVEPLFIVDIDGALLLADLILTFNGNNIDVSMLELLNHGEHHYDLPMLGGTVMLLGGGADDNDDNDDNSQDDSPLIAVEGAEPTAEGDNSGSNGANGDNGGGSVTGQPSAVGGMGDNGNNGTNGDNGGGSNGANGDSGANGGNGGGSNGDNGGATPPPPPPQAAPPQLNPITGDFFSFRPITVSGLGLMGNGAVMVYMIKQRKKSK